MNKLGVQAAQEKLTIYSGSEKVRKLQGLM
jgi:hypothetical protein